MNEVVVYVSRRNLLTLLSKLDRAAKGEITSRTIVKLDTDHPSYPCTLVTTITAVEDEDYYKHRAPGSVLAVDDPSAKP